MKIFKTGMYLMETLTAGMYNNPFSIYREYIQNSVDAIDKLNRTNGKNNSTISIKIDPINKRITFKDNGCGIKSELAESILSSIGISEKLGKDFRGFRGIGRLGGIAFSNKVVFRTKAKFELIESVQKWDCCKLREVLQNPNDQNFTLEDLYNSSVTFFQRSVKSLNSSYFIVTLEQVSSFRNIIFDITKVKKYLQDTAPLPFKNDFTMKKKIESQLKTTIPNYNHYKITLNGEQLFKPFRNSVNTSNKKSVPIENIDFVTINIFNEPVAFGWIGKRAKLLGGISKSEAISGLRVRKGNILIGDSHFLDNCFRESRFNSYIIGEIHVFSNNIIPNSRRDDFNDNKYKSLFLNEIEKYIGLPISKDIRETSRLNSIINNNKEIIKNNNKVYANFSHINSEIQLILINSVIKDCGRCKPKIHSKLSKYK